MHCRIIHHEKDPWKFFKQYTLVVKFDTFRKRRIVWNNQIFESYKHSKFATCIFRYTLLYGAFVHTWIFNCNLFLIWFTLALLASTSMYLLLKNDYKTTPTYGPSIYIYLVTCEVDVMACCLVGALFIHKIRCVYTFSLYSKNSDLWQKGMRK